MVMVYFLIIYNKFEFFLLIWKMLLIVFLGCGCGCVNIYKVDISVFLILVLCNWFCEGDELFILV